VRGRSEIVGTVDFGSREIRVIIARKDTDGTIQIIGHGAAHGHGAVSQGVIQDLSAAQVCLKEALRAAEAEARIKVMTLFCGINGRNVETFIREGQIELDTQVVEQRHMDEALDMASRDVLENGKRVVSSLAAQEWYIDDLRVADPLGITGHILKIRVHFARIPAVIEDNIAICVESQRRELEDVIFMPLAAALGCLTPEDRELGVAVLDMGRMTTGLAVFRDRRILGTNSFDWGGYHLTRDVAAGLHVSFEEADDLILEYGITGERIAAEGDEDAGNWPPRRRTESQIKLKTAVHGAPTVVDRDALDVIVFERAKELMTKVRQHLESRGYAKHLVRGVVLTGGAASIKNFVHLAEIVFQTPCRAGMPLGVDIVPPEARGPEFSGAIGLVRHGFDYRAAARAGRIRLSVPVAVRHARQIGEALRRYFRRAE
jgi:cell division protein FtsA